MKTCLVIYNPNSGKYNKEETLPKIKQILEENIDSALKGFKAIKK